MKSEGRLNSAASISTKGFVIELKMDGDFMKLVRQIARRTTQTRIRRVSVYMCTEIEVRASPPKAQRRVEEEEEEGKRRRRSSSIELLRSF